MTKNNTPVAIASDVISTFIYHVFMDVFLIHGFDTLLEQFWFLNVTDAVVQVRLQTT